MSSYHQLLSLSIKHDYYTDGNCPDFDIVPTEETANIFSKHRLIYKKENSTARIFCPLYGKGNDEKILIALDKIKSFTFGLNLKKPSFSAFTDLPENKIEDRPDNTAGKLWFGLRKTYIFQNKLNSKKLTEESYFLLRDFLPVNLDTSDEAVTITVKNDAGEAVLDKEFFVPREEGETRGSLKISIDIAQLNDGVYTVSSSSKPTDKTDIFILKNAGSNCFRFVHLKFKSTDLMSSSEKPKSRRDYEVSFKAVKKIWTYYTTLIGTDASHDYKIIHVPEAGNDEIDFENAVVEENIPKKKKIRITTTNKVAFRQSPHSNIKLMKISGGNETAVIEKLPNPDPAKTTPEVYLQL